MSFFVASKIFIIQQLHQPQILKKTFMKKLWIYAAVAVSLFSCSNDNLSDLNDVNQVSELSISTSVLSHTAKSKAVFTTNNGDDFYTGPVMAEELASNSNIGVSVFNAGTSTLYTTANNGSAENLKWNNTNGWTYIGADGSALKFFLGSAKADLYAYFPYTNTNYNLTAIPVQAGYTDFMYGVAKENGSINSSNKNASILLNHGLAMISFTFTKGAGYTGDCDLQSITVKNTPLAGTMNVKDGAISAGVQKTNIHIASFVDGAYTPSNINEAVTGADWSDWSGISFKESALGKPDMTNKVAGQFHAMVLPVGFNSGIQNDDSYFTVKIDDIVYDIAFKQGTGNAIKWDAGKNHTYNLTLNGGNELVITSVTINPWGEGEGGDIEI